MRSASIRISVAALVATAALGLAWWAIRDFVDFVDPPYPPSPVIIDLQFGTPARLSPRRAGDNWPLTWADDGHLYTTWGDGRGFEPQIERLSMGFARIEGSPPEARGINIRSADEQHGDGRRGRKGSGILMVDGVLYLWARNADGDGQGCQLAWSTDRAQNWTWADWTFGEFGYCTFINFGPDYSGARDDYVYMVSHDHPNAYVYADHFILARVPRERMNDRNAYEFFVHLNSEDTPEWSARIDDRGPVFNTRPGRAQRSGISYNASLGRYLWWQAGWPNPDGEDSRFNTGPLGIYDAPEPWGPWTTVFHTERFRGGPGETGSFPTKWMGPVESGRQSLYMVTSRDDAFTVWPVSLEIAVSGSAD